MTPREFAFWLQGYFEIAGENKKTLDEKQVEIIKNHLNLVFFHEANVNKPPVPTPLFDFLDSNSGGAGNYDDSHNTLVRC